MSGFEYSRRQSLRIGYDFFASLPVDSLYLSFTYELTGIVGFRTSLAIPDE